MKQCIKDISFDARVDTEFCIKGSLKTTLEDPALQNIKGISREAQNCIRPASTSCLFAGGGRMDPEVPFLEASIRQASQDLGDLTMPANRKWGKTGLFKAMIISSGASRSVVRNGNEGV